MSDAADPSDLSAPEFDGRFALCLTHDVDRPYKTYQSLFYALSERRLSHLASLLPGINPYWQFEEVMAVEEDLGVRSAFYFLDAKYLFTRPLGEWVQPFYWLERLGAYDVTSPAIARVIRALDDGGWEVGLHGSYGTHRNRERLRTEKHKLEAVLGHEVRGGRQHYLELSDPPTGTWASYRDSGLAYDASLGSSSEYGFRHGYDLLAPFGDDFRVFPLTLMEVALADASNGEHGRDDDGNGHDGLRRGIDVEAAWAECERLLEEAAANGAVMTVLWHPRYFHTEDFPGYRELYRRLVERALSMDAWVGPPADLYATIEGIPSADGNDPAAGARPDRSDAAGTDATESGPTGSGPAGNDTGEGEARSR